MNYRLILPICFFFVVFSLSALPGNCQLPVTPSVPVASTYSRTKAPDPDGTGIVYMGREIARIMDFTGADWLERDIRQKEERTNLAIAKLPVTNSSKVADIGAGTGYYTFKIAPRVQKGIVYAVEVQPELISYLKKKKAQLRASNVEVIASTSETSGLPAESIDLALLVDVYHELRYPHEMLQSIRAALRPGGKIVLLEYRAEDPNVPIKTLHKMSVKQVTKELEANGFTFYYDGEFLPWQHFLEYIRK